MSSDVISERAVGVEDLLGQRRVAVDDDVAAVLRTVRMDATVLGEDRSGLFVLSDIWFDDDAAGLRVWKRHSTPLTAGRMPGADA